MCQCCVKIFLGLKTGSDRLKTKHDKINWSMSMSNSMGHVLRNRDERGREAMVRRAVQIRVPCRVARIRDDVKARPGRMAKGPLP